VTVRVLSLFSGAGGSCLGWHSLGASHVACVERDPHALATLRAAGFPALEMDLSDPEQVRELGWLRGSVDVLEASPPCQAWSTAGARLGARDPRNGWPWTWAAVDAVRPRWLVAENVPGLLSHRGTCATHEGGYADPDGCPGCYWSEEILREARARFAWVSWWMLDAADFGVPQRRRRVFLVCGPSAAAPPVATHGDPAKIRQAGLFGPRLRPWVSMRTALDLGPAADVIGGGRNASDGTRSYREIADEPCVTVPAVQVGNAGPWVVDGPSPSITVGHCSPIANADLSPQISVEILTLQHMQGAPRALAPTAPALGTMGNAYLSSDLSLLDRPSLTVTGSDGKGSTLGSCSRRAMASDLLCEATGGARRRLTPAECARLQDFPDDHPWQGTQTAIYRQIGNAVPPALARAVGAAVIAAAQSVREVA